jgi:1,2-diacylglycerol 3-alpha-glucosyltransferase
VAQPKSIIASAQFGADLIKKYTSPAISVATVKLALISSGLGHVNRGFEISTARWFDALRAHTSLDVRLFCGGDHPGGKKVWNFPRNSFWTAPFQYLPFCQEQQRWELCYGFEQLSFWSALNLDLLEYRPDVVWIKDIPLAHFLFASRAMLGLRFKIILCNGGMLRPQTYKDFDVIQQMSRAAYEEALDFGIPREKMELISNCCPQISPTTDRETTRRQLGFQSDEFVIISVAAWNKYHKRIDYLIREVAAMNDPKVKLLLCGAPEVDASELKELGHSLLGDRVRWITVPPNEVPNLLTASDAFVLASLRESLGNALLEAVLVGLPVVTHAHDGARFILQDQQQWTADLSQPNILRDRLLQLKNHPPDRAELEALKQDVAHRFSDAVLAEQFERMVKACLSAN